MLEFWFNPQVSVLKKLLIFIVIAATAAGLYWMEPLPLDSILMFVGTGIIFLICRYCKIHFASKNPTGLLYRLLTWIPIALLIALVFMNMQQGEILIPGAQGIAFMALAICLVFSTVPAQSEQIRFGFTPCLNFGIRNAVAVKSNSSLSSRPVFLFMRHRLWPS